MNPARRLLFLVVAALALACRQGPPEPQEPVWGKQACAHCAMLVSRPDSAAQYADTQGDVWFFDDLGCLVAWQVEHPAKPGDLAWARQGKEWREVGKAHYSSGHTTPMDFGFVADPAGTAVWSDVQQAVQQRLKAPALGR